MNEYRIGTKCVQGGYTPGNGEPRQIPIVQSTTFKYATSEDMGKLFDLEASGYFYSRLQNPTNDMVAAKIAEMEGGTAAMLTSSGQAANFFALFNICECGDHIVASSSIYGGTFNLIDVTMRKMGIDVTFVSPDATEEELNAAFKPNTKVMFGETIANPALTVLDIELFAKVAHAHGVPLIVDNTFPTPVNCRPFEWGADIVTHSTTKYMDGHGAALGGAIVDSGKFDWMAHADKYPGLCTPDESYHGITYAEKFGKEGAFILMDNCQDVICGGFAPNSEAADTFSKALGSRTVLSGSVSRGKNDPSQSLQMMERPLLTADELKSIPKGSFIVQKTGCHPMRTRLRLFLEWGITFEEEYRVEEQAARRVYYADQNALTRAIVRKYPPKMPEKQTTRSVKGEGQLHDAPVQEIVVAEDIDYDRMPHKRTPYNLPRQEVDR